MKKNSNLSQKNALKQQFFSFLLSCVMLAPYLYICFLSVPVSDDFQQGADSLDRGIWGQVYERYIGWNGRYFSDFFIAASNVIGEKLSDHFLIHFFPVFPLFFILSFVVVAYVFSVFIGYDFEKHSTQDEVIQNTSEAIEILADENKNNALNFRKTISTLCFAVVLTVFVLSGIELQSTIYWLAGGAAYTLGNTIFLLSLGIIIFDIYYRDSIRFNLWTGISILLIFAVNGSSEVSMVSTTTFISSLLIINLLTRNIQVQGRIKLIWLEFATIVSSLILILSPGNQVRAAVDRENISLLNMLINSLGTALKDFFSWTNILWLCLIILSILTFDYLLSARLKAFWKNPQHLGSILASLGLALYMSYFTRFYSLGDAGPPRSNSTSFFLFALITVFFALYILVNWNLHSILKTNHFRLQSPTLILITTLLFCFNLIFTPSFESVISDIRKANTHTTYHKEAYACLLSAKPDSTVLISPEPRVSVMRRTAYLSQNSDAYNNKVLAKYFGVQSVAVTDTDTTPVNCIVEPSLPENDDQ